MKTKYKNNQKQSKNKWLLLLLGVILLLASLCLLYYRSQSKNMDTTNTAIDNQDEGGVNYSPPTESEKQTGDTKKQQIESDLSTQTKQPSSTSTQSKKAVTVVMTSHEVAGSNVEVAGYAEGIIEKDGVCTVTFTQNSKKITQKQAALDDAQYTSCGVIGVPVSKFSKGTWKVVLSYQSSKYSGVSPTESIIIK